MLNVWERGFIPTINLRSIERKINHSVDYYLGMMKSFKKEVKSWRKRGLISKIIAMKVPKEE